MAHKIIKTDDYLLVLGKNYKSDSFPYIVAENLTTGDYQLWQVDNPNDIDEPNQFEILAHLPLNGSPVLKDVVLLPPIKDDAEELAKEEIKYDGMNFIITNYTRSGFIIGYNKAKEKFLLEIDKQILDFTHDLKKTSSQHQRFEGALFGLNRLKYYLSKYPTEFECEMIPCNPIKYTTEDHLDVEPKTITTAQGIQWVGKYK